MSNSSTQHCLLSHINAEVAEFKPGIRIRQVELDFD